MIKKIIVFISTVISITTFGMYGGQKNKSVRRYGIPGVALIASWINGFSWRDLALLLLIPILCMGYGVNSQLMGIFHSDTIVRVVYAFLLSLPFIVYGLKRWIFAILSLVLAFQIRAGSLGTIPFFGDILIEDIIRYCALGSNIAFNIIFRRKSSQ